MSELGIRSGWLRYPGSADLLHMPMIPSMDQSMDGLHFWLLSLVSVFIRRYLLVSIDIHPWNDCCLYWKILSYSDHHCFLWIHGWKLKLCVPETWFWVFKLELYRSNQILFLSLYLFETNLRNSLCSFYGFLRTNYVQIILNISFIYLAYFGIN
jgi:hypothetical protein